MMMMTINHFVVDVLHVRKMKTKNKNKEEGRRTKKLWRRRETKKMMTMMMNNVDYDNEQLRLQ